MYGSVLLSEAEVLPLEPMPESWKATRVVQWQSHALTAENAEHRLATFGHKVSHAASARVIGRQFGNLTITGIDQIIWDHRPTTWERRGSSTHLHLSWVSASRCVFLTLSCKRLTVALRCVAAYIRGGSRLPLSRESLLDSVASYARCQRADNSRVATHHCLASSVSPR